MKMWTFHCYVSLPEGISEVHAFILLEKVGSLDQDGSFPQKRNGPHRLEGTKPSEVREDILINFPCYFADKNASERSLFLKIFNHKTKRRLVG